MAVEEHSATTEAGVVRSCGFGLGQMLPALERASAAFVDLLRTVGPDEAQRSVPDMTWSVAETAAHMLTIVRRGMGDRRRADDLEGLGRLNDEQIGEVDEGDPQALANLIEADMKTYLGFLAAVTDEDAKARPVRLHAGVRADVPTALSYQLFDFLAHGDDIARALDRPWSIPAGDAVLVLQASLPALEPWVERDVLAGPAQRVALTFPRCAWGLVISVGDGAYEVSEVPRDEAEAEPDPVELFLAIAGRRVPTDGMTSRVAAWFQPI